MKNKDRNSIFNFEWLVFHMKLKISDTQNYRGNFNFRITL
ncbi:hypothetical protein CRENPOLYSF2_3820002 [Crenothrix polyspora]|uniref:Uncharacterized protein n=1 Tax=Crenothrix polyspora TaxID=360316 RepID=A0A1R4HDA7_9GAMM|nr:hypothetical protein CRENPOLYSF2_3820002 [Crenothrix polyspora]